MKKFELTLNVYAKNERGDMHSIDVVVSDNLVHLLAQFMIVLVGIQKKLDQHDMVVNDDDIPF